MLGLQMKKRKTITTGKRYQRGLVALEFSIVGGVLFMVLFMALEAGRLMYSLIILDSYTRVAARLVAVCPVDNVGQATVKADAQFMALPNFNNDNINLRYLDENFNPKDPSIVSDFIAIRFVEASIVNYQHPMIIPGLNITIDVPAFTTVIPSESLGILPASSAGGDFSC